jgi:anaerobic selenocysteine-containing dehydrogenase
MTGKIGGVAVDERVTFCRICEPLCGMVATVDNGRLTQLRPDRDHPLSKGYACPKGIAMADVQNDPDRVVYPLKRVGGPGEFERVTWE